MLSGSTSLNQWTSSPDLSLLTWSNLGIHKIKDLYTQNELKTFPTLQSEFSLNPRDIFTYLRVKNILQTRIKPAAPTPPLAIPSARYILTSRSIKPLALCYNALEKGKSMHKHSYMEKWEEDIGEPITIQQWYDAFQATKRASKSLSLWEAYSKIAMPHYLLHILPTTSPTRNPLSTIAIIILTAAKVAIASKWKHNVPPTQEEVTRRVDSICIYEQMAHKIQGTSEKHNTYWRGWLDARKETVQVDNH
ncbi:Hypothetical predicted protein [Pelobates cultripes]|uniref:Uncharacterized protein n=1 Tax=Pelobates cultripes TaxID=61616 RepID=A0AAD1SAB3_PELCU|nr:Hypothetical predicted protein [Pelobates cultripes]